MFLLIDEARTLLIEKKYPDKDKHGNLVANIMYDIAAFTPPMNKNLILSGILHHFSYTNFKTSIPLFYHKDEVLISVILFSIPF